MRALVCAVAAAVLGCAAVARAEDAQKAVLILSEYRPDRAVNISRERIIRETLSEAFNGSIEYFAEYVDAAGFPEASYLSALIEFLRSKYEHKQFDAVIAIGRNALDFARGNGEDVFGRVPIVAASVDRAAIEQRSDGLPVTGVARRIDVRGTVDFILDLQPATKEIVVVAGGANAAYLQSLARDQLRDRQPAIAVEYLIGLPMNDLLAQVARLPATTVILYLGIFGDGAGERWLPGDALTSIVGAASVPVYGVAASNLDYGLVGGTLHDTDMHAREVAELTVEQLRRGKRETVPVRDSRSTAPMANWRELRRWGLTEARLPAGTIVRHRDPTAWEQYRWYIVAAVSLVSVQALLIAALVAQRARRRESEARRSATLRAIPDRMFLQTMDGVYVDYHAPSDDLLLARPEQFIGRNMRDVLPPPLALRFEQCFRQLATSAEPAVVEYDLPSADGLHNYEARLVRTADNHVLSVVRDISERRRAEQAVLEAQQRYELAAAAGAVGVWDWNVKTNDLYVDPSLKRILGFDEDEIRNDRDDWMTRLYPEDADLAANRAAAHVEGLSPFYEVEHRMLHKDGSLRWFLVRGSAVERQDGKATRVLGTYTDITERKRAEAALQKAEVDLSRMSGLVTLAEFAASIAHEVNQPLSAVVMNASSCLRWLSAPSPDLAEVREALRDIVESGKRASQVISHTRELVRHRELQKTLVDINDVVREVVTLAHTRLDAGRVSVRTELTPGLPPVEGDRVQLKQVLLNLVANAADAMSAVPVGSRTLKIETSVVAEGVEVSVCDSGPGVASADLERLFTRFYTTKPDGTGIGLWISRSILEAHGGRLWATQNPDEGATFRLRIPSETVGVSGARTEVRVYQDRRT